jgi:hypothetical protein
VETSGFPPRAPLPTSFDPLEAVEGAELLLTPTLMFVVPPRADVGGRVVSAAPAPERLLAAAARA